MSGPLSGIRVIDVSNVLAGPVAGQVLGDYGAEVIKIEHPQHLDGLRNLGKQIDGTGIWWKVISRNKKVVGLNIGCEEGQEVFRKLVGSCDVVIENFRPGTMEKWNLDFPSIASINNRVILLRITGFGQDGTYANRPAFGTLIEAMSGFAQSMGEANGPPVLPPLGLADSLAGISGALAVVMALYHRDRNGGSGLGQEIDLSILEPLVSIMSPQPSVYDKTGELPARMGNKSDLNAPRNLYRTRDGKWIAMSTSTTQIAERVMRCIGHGEVCDQEWFSSGQGRVERADLLDGLVAEWVAQRDRDQVIELFEEAQAAVGPVYSVAELMADPHAISRGIFQRVPDDELGSVLMPGLLFRMSQTPGEIRFAGKKPGSDTLSVLADIGVSEEDLVELRSIGVI